MSKNELVKEYELEPIYNWQNSYYKKAHVKEYADGRKELISYHTKVAECKGNTMILYGYYSTTTWKHIREFMAQNNIYIDTSTKIGKRLAKYAKECDEFSKMIIIKDGKPEMICSKRKMSGLDRQYHKDMDEYEWKMFYRRYGIV